MTKFLITRQRIVVEEKIVDTPTINTAGDALVHAQENLAKWEPAAGHTDWTYTVVVGGKPS